MDEVSCKAFPGYNKTRYRLIIQVWYASRSLVDLEVSSEIQKSFTEKHTGSIGGGGLGVEWIFYSFSYSGEVIL